MGLVGKGGGNQRQLSVLRKLSLNNIFSGVKKVRL